MPNPFGGKNDHGLYVPMTDIETETLLRLWELRQYDLRVIGWGSAKINDCIIGDHRLALQVTLGPECFEHLESPISIPFLEVELWAKNRKLFGPKKYPLENNGFPYLVKKGDQTLFQFDLAIESINPELIKEVNSKVLGLTTRWGNMQLNPLQRTLLKTLSEGKKKSRQIEQENLAKIFKKKG